MIPRDTQKHLEKWLFKGKILILYGARQVGKTTLSKSILNKYSDEKSYFNCEIIHIRKALENADPIALKKFLGDGKVIVLDEAQKVKNIGLSLKLLIDTYPDIQIIATGSSSFTLSHQLNEPLTGRALEFILYPLSVSELSHQYRDFEINGQLESLLRFGSYPEIIQAGEQDAKVLLDNLASKYLYQDILELENIKKSDTLSSLLELLALQVGSEVSEHELAVSLQSNRETIRRYISLLEKSFVIFRLRAFSRNLRKEIAKKQKIYFYDVGIRNSIIKRYMPLRLRDDTGALWENFLIVERMKYLQDREERRNQFFWRTHDQKEIDYIEEYEGGIAGYEFKWSRKKVSLPKVFLSTYAGSSLHVITKENYLEFVRD